MEALIPCDFRVYDKPLGGGAKNEHFREMLQKAQERGFKPRYVLFDNWYSSLKNLKAARSYGWLWLTRLKSNRLFDPDGKGNVNISALEEVLPEGRIVHLKGYGFIRVFRTASRNGGAEYWATSDLDLTEEKREELETQGWGIETYHRGIKQCCGIEKSQVRSATAQKRHILLAIRSFIRLEAHRLRTGVSWYKAKVSIIREAVRTYLANPTYIL